MAEFEVSFDVKQPSVEANFTVAEQNLEALFEINAGTHVDDALSEESKNPVQNKVITKALEEVAKDKDRHFTYEQAAPSDVWVIVHDLDKKPSITVVDSADTVITPDNIEYNDMNTATVYFLAAFAGKAYCN